MQRCRVIVIILYSAVQNRVHRMSDFISRTGCLFLLPSIPLAIFLGTVALVCIIAVLSVVAVVIVISVEVDGCHYIDDLKVFVFISHIFLLLILLPCNY